MPSSFEMRILIPPLYGEQRENQDEKARLRLTGNFCSEVALRQRLSKWPRKAPLTATTNP